MLSSTKKQNIIAIVGPTASGKSDLAISLAHQFNGEIISADSRQVYRGMDIGSGKVTEAEQKQTKHYLLDVTSPSRQYTVAHFVRDAKRSLQTIYKHGNTPIICGGTGFWIDTLIYDLPIATVKPNKKLRKKLSKKSAAELYGILKKLNPARAKTIDKQNPVRLIRAIEIEKAGFLPRLPQKTTSPYHTLWIGVDPGISRLKKQIAKRLNSRLRKGMIAEVKRLHASGVSWKRLEELGLEYRYVSRFLQGKISRESLRSELQKEIQRYAKRQRTWFKRNPDIHWIHTAREAKRLARTFLKNPS